MNGVDPIRDAVVATLAAVPDIGRVHAYERYASRRSELATLYQHQGQLRGWFLRRVRQSETSSSLGRITRVVTWVVRGYMAWSDDDASQLVFEGLLDSAIAAFRVDESLGGAVDSTVVGESAGLQLLDAGPVMFADVLCHGAELQLLTRDYG